MSKGVLFLKEWISAGAEVIGLYKLTFFIIRVARQ
jgi:hypothetical protein